MQRTSTSPESETARKEAEISSVEQQIRDKQKRIVLLMRLFVDDERAFVNDPANVNVDPAVAERRRYEQDELHWETAELARLKSAITSDDRQPLVHPFAPSLSLAQYWE